MWNHRVLAYQEGDETHYQIHEVHYDEQGNPIMYTENPVRVSAESLVGMLWVLDKMKACLYKPVLSMENFPRKYEVSPAEMKELGEKDIYTRIAMSAVEKLLYKKLKDDR
jgi:hypothetical protein